MEHLYAPWRGDYTRNAQCKADTCPFCPIIQEASNDDKNFVVQRNEQSIVILNLYPYNPGHLLLLPHDHAAKLDDVSITTRQELMETMNNAIEKMTTALGCQGVNVGINLGQSCAGGSIPEHLHIHLVPRWQGDTNFLPVVAGTKQVSQDLRVVFEKLKKSF